LFNIWILAFKFVGEYIIELAVPDFTGCDEPELPNISRVERTEILRKIPEVV
jgi:hypothetical protein